MNTPINEIESYIDKFNDFNQLWKNIFSLMPEVPNDYKQRDNWESFAKKIWGSVYNEKELRLFIDKVYDEKFGDIDDQLNMLQDRLMDSIDNEIEHIRENIKTI